jgi:hypothetical protein
MSDELQCVKLERMMEHAFGREATSDERKKLLRLYNEFRTLAAASPTEAAKLIGAHKPTNARPEEAAAWVGVARAILNLDEFVTRE